MMAMNFSNANANVGAGASTTASATSTPTSSIPTVSPPSYANVGIGNGTGIGAPVPSTSISSASPFPDSSLFVQRLRDQETARRVSVEEQRRQEEDARRAHQEQLVRTQTDAVSVALRNALNDPNATHVEVSFSEQVRPEVLRTITSNGYEYSLNYTNDNGTKSSLLKVYPRGTIQTTSRDDYKSLYNALDRYFYSFPSSSLDRILSFRPWNINTYRLL